MEHHVTVVGIGPGSPDYILPAALRAIGQASVLIGSARALTTYAKDNQRMYKIDGDIDGLIRLISAELLAEDPVVMVSGDPGYFSLLAALREALPAETLRVIPGISSFQVAFSRIGVPWQNASLISAHGREPDNSQLHHGVGRVLSFLTDSRNNPPRIAGRLLQVGWPAQTCVWLCRDLSYEEETVIRTTLGEALNIQGFDSCVMVVMG